MILFPPCKINLGLNIVARRPDGFHDLETIFYPVPLHDILEIIPSKGLEPSFTSSGIDIPGDPQENLCMKAYRMIRADHDIPPVQIHLHKVIPIGAGLGGGSADGTYTLRLLDQLFSLGLGKQVLADYARGLGSDCAFFLENETVYAHGKGDQFEPVSLSLAGYRLVLVFPPVHVSTAMAYAGVKPACPERNVKEIIAEPPETWRNALKNDFETHVFSMFPLIKSVRDQLYEAGAVYASMTGSGSAVYGIFKKGAEDLGPVEGTCQILDL